jgi:hypothetical protein
MSWTTNNGIDELLRTERTELVLCREPGVPRADFPSRTGEGGSMPINAAAIARLMG